MILWSIVLFLIGLLLSAFFSGSETGFYRASRVRWVLDGIEGDRLSKFLLRLGNTPSLFVATSLIGNNLANFLISFSVVMGTRALMESAQTIEIVASLLMTPIVFVYGELLPKNLFYRAPNRLLRRIAIPYLGFFVIFSPVVAALWTFGRALERWLGQSPEQVRLTLARRELEQILQEGQEVGLLHPAQRELGQNFFLVAAIPIEQNCVNIKNVHSLPLGSSVQRALYFADRFRLEHVLLYQRRKANLVGYVRTVDLLLSPNREVPIENPRPLKTLVASEHTGEAIMHMQTERIELATVVNAKDQVVGVVSLNDLTEPLFKPAG